MASIAPTTPRAKPMLRRDPRLIEALRDYPLTVVWFAFTLLWVALVALGSRV